MSAREDVLITAAELARLLDAGEPITLLDVRWSLPEPNGTAAYERGHLPGAVYVSLDDDLTDHDVPGRGRHPLPSGSSLQAAARRWGVRTGVPVVAYDDWNRAGSARLWWVLTAAGIPDVRILDGGLAAWSGELHTGTATPEPGDVTIIHDDLYAAARNTVTADWGVKLRQPGRSIGGRAAQRRHRGRGSSPYRWPATFPARRVPSTSLLIGDGAWLSESELRRLFDARGGCRLRGGGLLRLGCHRCGRHRGVGRCRRGRRTVSRLVVGVEFGFHPPGGPRRVVDDVTAVHAEA